MRGMILRLLVAAMMVPVCVCQKQIDDEQKLVKIGNDIITRDQFDSFSTMARSYPSTMPHVFPADRNQITFMVETELLYQSIPFTFPRRKIRNSKDWQWTKRYFPAQMYASQVLRDNAGFMEEELREYYETHKERYKDTVTYTVDSASGEERDSIRYRSFGEVEGKITRAMVFDKYPPEPDFFTDYAQEVGADSAELMNRWYYHVRETSPDFFVDKIYQEVVGEDMPDSLGGWYGEGKVITPEDMEIIRGWIQESRRDYYSTPEGTKELAMWLLKWKIFSEKAERAGFTENNEEVGRVTDWAWRVHVVTEYIRRELLPTCKEMTDIDTAMCLYSYWDEKGSVVIPPDSAELAEEVQSQYLKQVGVNLASIIHDLREEKGVEFLQSDFKDARNTDPAKILAKADSLRDSSRTDAAIKEYRKLTHSFPFTEQGEKAFAELAKLQTERERYSAAIDNYRRLLITEELDDERACNYFFMIGFIYDEYLGKHKLAEVQYKWLLKNTPECDLCDDAEFMVLHLDEPMISIEELRRQAKAQGRDVEEEVVDTLSRADETAQ